MFRTITLSLLMLTTASLTALTASAQIGYGCNSGYGNFGNYGNGYGNSPYHGGAFNGSYGRSYGGGYGGGFNGGFGSLNSGYNQGYSNWGNHGLGYRNNVVMPQIQTGIHRDFHGPSAYRHGNHIDVQPAHYDVHQSWGMHR